ncbi:diaminopimelate decarboxylase [Pedobacter metabolipauper]|uniref:Diaminopimelate decarboxylase n=1 Tax=Pedobacter metabolipauper TaxID=425513 RepID=A0A4R6SZI4_9SPHI|nr:diaminopimelate decarboxylase [Pedobacter metabolipauper]TDQ11465.1 diaminopimelate decarboxylase [Pedobacter metabolipauper]
MFSDKDTAHFANLETPFYYYDLNLLQKTLSTCADAAKVYNFHVHYAMKANFNNRVLEKIRATGFGADCVSGGEVNKAVEIGFEKGQIVFAGVGKSDKEINDALDQDIFCFNVESIQELEIIDELAAKKGKKTRVAIRINPNVDAHTHHNITTGLDENKFGINSWDLPLCAETLKKCANLEFIGIHFHIGSQITNLDVYKNLCVRVNEFAIWFEERGFVVKVLNVGGGLGIDYHNPDGQIPDFPAYFKIFNDFLEVRPNQEVHFELGRALVGQCSSLISKVLYVKNGKKKNFIILDAGMTELMRPALYQAYHKIENISKSAEVVVKYDVVGPICESTDCFGKEVELPETLRGDLIALRSTGAYGEVMASHYNLRENVNVAFSD